jgi:hypothetical protein
VCRVADILLKPNAYCEFQHARRQTKFLGRSITAADSRFCTRSIVREPLSEFDAGPLKHIGNHHFQKTNVKHFQAIQTALENYFPFVLITGVE